MDYKKAIEGRRRVWTVLNEEAEKLGLNLSEYETPEAFFAAYNAAVESTLMPDLDNFGKFLEIFTPFLVSIEKVAEGVLRGKPVTKETREEICYIVRKMWMR